MSTDKPITDEATIRARMDSDSHYALTKRVIELEQSERSSLNRKQPGDAPDYILDEDNEVAEQAWADGWNDCLRAQQQGGNGHA